MYGDYVKKQKRKHLPKRQINKSDNAKKKERGYSLGTVMTMALKKKNK